MSTAIEPATRDLLRTVERNIDRLMKAKEAGGSLGIAAFSIAQDLKVDYLKLRAAVADFDEENTTCPLCGSPRQPTLPQEMLSKP